MSFRLQPFIVVFSLVAIMAAAVCQFSGVLSPDVPLIITIIVGGIPSLIYILSKLIKGDLGADTLAALALITAVILNQYLAAVFIILMLASGQSLEAYAMRKASSVLLALAERMPSFAHRKTRDDEIENVPLLSIHVGDEVVIYPHETCPVDGVVVDGYSSMDESYLTGEPYQMSKAPGAFVISGAINGESPLTVKAEKMPSDSRYASIVAVLEEAEQKRPNLRRLGDQIGAIFAPVALVLALIAWYVTGDAVRFLAVLVIATPCPLLIAIPITLISAISLAAKRGIIIKDPTVLERLPTCRTAIFDKTGTLTYGKPELTEIITAEGFKADEVLQYVAALEQYSKHPLAGAVLKEAKNRHLEKLKVNHVSEIPGHGLSGVIGDHNIVVTHRKKIISQFPELTREIPEVVSGLECMIMIDGKYAAVMRFHDLPRKDSQSFIGHLAPSHQFKKIMLISGDRESEVNYLGALLHLTELHASQTPEQKLAIVREEASKQATLFMGDGVNDAPALTAATVGIAFGQYSHVTTETSGVVIMENTLKKVDELLHLSYNTRRIALQSAIGGMLLSVVGMAFAAAGYISPVAGAILQEVIDIIAIMNSLRLIWGSHIEVDLP